MVSSGASRHALVVGADVMSSIIDYTDRATCVLFGDGAGAVVVEASDDDEHRHHRLRELRRRQRRPGALHAGRRQPAAGVARDRRAAAALREAGRPDGVQVRGAQHRGGLPPHPRAQRDHSRARSTCSCRTRPTAASSSPPPRSSACRDEKVVINIERFGNTTAGDDPAGAERRGRGGPPEARRSRAAGVGRRRLHGRRGAAEMGLKE